MIISERQVRLRKGGNFPNLDDYLDKREATTVTFSPSPTVRSVTIASNSQVVSLNGVTWGAYISGGKVAVGAGTQIDRNGLVCAPTAVFNTAAPADYFADEFGNILNLVDIRFADNNNEVFVGDYKPAGPDATIADDSRKVWGLIQTTSPDLTLIAGSQIQMTFVYFDATDAPVVATVNRDIEFEIRVVAQRRWDSAQLTLKGGSNDRDILDLAKALIPQKTVYLRTTAAIAAPATFNIQAGTPNVAYVYPADPVTLVANNVMLPATKDEFRKNGKVIVSDNGVTLPKQDLGVIGGYFVDWVTPTDILINRNFDAGDFIAITAPASY